MAETSEDPKAASEPPAPQAQRPAAVDRIVSSLTNGQKVLVALAGLLVAAGGVWAAAQHFTGGSTPPPTGSVNHTSSSAPNLAVPASESPGTLLSGPTKIELNDGGSLAFPDAVAGTVYAYYYEEGSNLTAMDGSQIAVLAAGEAGTYANCAADTNYGEGVNLTTVSVGSMMCIETPPHRLVLLTILPDDANTPANGLVLDVTYWQGTSGT